MEKKRYRAPLMETIYMNINGDLLDWTPSIWEGGTDPVVIDAKRNTFDDEDDFLDDEEIDPRWSFNVWED